MTPGSETTIEAPQTPLESRPEGPAAPSQRAVVAALAAMAASWLAAGSTGLLAHPLRHGLTWVALAVAILATWSGWRRGWQARLATLAPALLVTAVATASATTTVYAVLAVALVMAILAWGHAGVEQRALLIPASAAALLGLYSLACTSIPTVWLLADAVGYRLGEWGEWATRKPLQVGATFAGLDFLVLMAAVYAAWLAFTRPPRLARAIWAAVAILGGHTLYLVLLAHATDFRAALPPPSAAPELRDNLYLPPPWSWSDAVRTLVPWNVPSVAGLIQLAVAAAMFRWAAWLPLDKTDAQVGEANEGEGKKRVRKGPQTRTDGSRHESTPSPQWREKTLAWTPAVLAVLLPVLATFSPGETRLTGKTVVAYDKGYLDWEKPVHDSYGEASAGFYGMLPDFLASLGGQFKRSADLSQEDLADADVLLLIHPVGTWPPERLERIRRFVRQGGSLLLLAETMVQEDDLASAFNQVLEGTALRVRFDTAIPEVGDWQHAYTAMSHPAATGISDRRNRFGLLWGPSIEVRWPARPILVGRWGWSDPGVDAVLTGAYRLDAGERLGDLVLAAEQRVANGRIVVLSDTSSFTNLGSAGAYVFTGRLLAYLAGGASDPQTVWRQVFGLLVGLGLLGLMAWPPAAGRLAVVAALLVLSLAGARTVSHMSMRVLPDGRGGDAPFNSVAYIDASHLEAYSDSAWGYDGIAGLQLTLMRNGYVPFLLPQLTSERLDRAGLLISIAPGRPFSAAERAVVRRFVEHGGIFICTVGAETSRVVEPLLNDFGLRVPSSPVRPGETAREPKPMGHFTTPYLRENDYQANVMFYAGWPIECQRADAVVYGFDDLPVIARREVGKGTVILVADGAFARNKNLEYVGGEPFNGKYQNAHFWRWLISTWTGREEWSPPNERSADSQKTPDAADTGPAPKDPSEKLSSVEEVP